MPGVIRTRVGYAGGKQKNPTYHDIGDHSESFQVDFDPKQISFEKLLETFWRSPNSCDRSGTLQYRSIVFYQNDAQKKLALASREREAAKRGYAVETPILPLESFTLAEDYHQKFYLRQEHELEKEIAAVYPNLDDFTNSTAAMKLNAYLGGYGSRKALDGEIDRLGLSMDAKKRLRELVGSFADTPGEGR
jgi:peptide-methionine (S)-S-oxide reductase